MLRRVTTIGAVSAKPPDIATDAHDFEAFARATLKKIAGLDAGGRVLLAGGVPANIFMPRPDLAAPLIKFGEAMRALDNGTASLQPYTLPNDATVRFAVIKTGSTLGWWPIAVQVVKVAGPWVLSAAAVYLADGWLDARKADSAANETRANTENALAGYVQALEKRGDTAGAQRLAQTVAQASQAANAAEGTTSWLDTLKTAAAGAGVSSALLALGALYLFSKRKGKRAHA
jgi:hypothetical protein